MAYEVVDSGQIVDPAASTEPVGSTEDVGPFAEPPVQEQPSVVSDSTEPLVSPDNPAAPPTKEPEPESEPEPFSPDEQLLNVARELRVSDEKVRSFKSESDAIAYLRARADAIVEFRQQESQRQQEAKPKAEPFKITLPEGVDPEVKTAFDALVARLEESDKTLAEQKGILGKFIEFAKDQSEKEAQQAVLREQHEFDATFDALGDEFAELFGKGHGSQLKTPSLFKNRQEVYNQFQRLVPKRGEKLEDAVLRAVYATFPNEVRTIERRRVTNMAKAESGKKSASGTRAAPEGPRNADQRKADVFREAGWAVDTAAGPFA